MLSSLVRCVRFAMILDQLCWLHQEVSVVYHHSVAGQIFRVGAAFFFSLTGEGRTQQVRL